MKSEQDTVPVGTGLVLDVGSVAHGGHCVARHSGQVVFVRHTLPGERVRAVVTEIGPGGKFLRADAVEVLRGAPERIVPPCPWSGPGQCGGCDWQHVDLRAQRSLKAAVVREQFTRLANLDLQEVLGRDITVESVPGDRDGLRWRTRVEFAVDDLGRPGLRRHRSHDIVPVEDCLIADPRIIETGVLSGSYAGSSAVDVVAPSLGETVMVEVPAAQGSATERSATERSATEGSATEGSATEGSATEGSATEGSAVTKGQAAKGSAAPNGGGRAGKRTQPPVAAPGVRERVLLSDGDLEFDVSARGFWQVHPGAARTFVSTTLDWLEPRAGEHVVDLYSGVGVFAAALARRVGPTGSVTAIEGDRVATENARKNLADYPWVEVQRDRVDRAVRRLLRSDHEISLVVLDPPRTGAGRAVCRDVAGLHARSIGYVACDPAALARDVGCLAEYGYRLRDLRVFDAFPMTHHMELVAVLDAV